MKANNEVRVAAKRERVPLYVLAHSIGVSEATMVRKLRFELPTEEKHRLLHEIERIALDQRKEAQANAAAEYADDQGNRAAVKG